MSTHSSSELLPAHQRRSNSILSASSRKAWEDDDNGHRLSSSSSGRLDTAQGHTELKTKVDNFDDNDQITSIEAREGGKRVAGTTPDSGLWPSIKRFLSAQYIKISIEDDRAQNLYCYFSFLLARDERKTF
ncbi:uncharacterized protein TRIADDRAFT_59282 [Trichoplax adhaerens]|uniref:Uncharacterized protein n=1 Tax=Trichoplax adhaerens TaxID=10228 RepID=B3S5C9_TRIAD|nr:predicted protein [Trichoplax adhaerens]EDV22241.1 predicted protein [Trichoplax adhaerens]|eukprot:XP_002115396.1 predicted protein [Trichoplax adhaerens]